MASGGGGGDGGAVAAAAAAAAAAAVDLHAVVGISDPYNSHFLQLARPLYQSCV